MAEFGYLKKLEITGESVAVYTFAGVVGKPAVKVRPANDYNPKFWSAKVALSRTHADMQQALAAAGVGDNDTAALVRQIDRQLYPTHIVIGFERAPYDGKTKQRVQGTVEEVREFIHALPDNLFDELRDFCISRNTFTAGVTQLEGLAGN